MKPLIPCLVCYLMFYGLRTNAQDEIEYFKDSGKRVQAKAIVGAVFHPLPNNLINFGKDSAYHWLRVGMINNSLEYKKQLFEVSFVWLDSVHFYKQDMTLIKALSWQTPFPQRLYPHQSFVLPVLLRPKSDTIIYARLYKKRMLIKGEVGIKTEEAFFADHIFSTAYYSFFTGIVAIAFIFSMAVFLINKDLVYLYYALYVLFCLGFTLTGAGFYLPLYQKGIGFISASELRNWLLWFALIFLLLFIRNHVLGGHVLNRINLIIWRITLGLLFSLVVQRMILIYFEQTSSVSPYVLLVIMVCCFLLIIVLTFYFVVYAYFKNINSSLVKNYLIGITPFFVFGVLSYSRTFEFVEQSWLLEQEVQVACVVFDIVVLMFGLSIRYRALREEKENQTRLALENKLALQYEKERISRDLHDSVGSQLTIIATSLDTATYQAYKQKLEPQKLEKINENVREAVQNLRDTIWATHQSKISLDSFDKRLRNYMLKAIEDRLEVSIDFGMINPDVSISSIQAVNLFRVIQEAIQNILKHAQATNITIKGEQTEEKIRIDIADNGIGMVESITHNKDSYGIQNMRSRMNEINGSLMIESVGGKGTIVSLELSNYATNAVLNH